jgi:hypothetical protein
MGDYEMIKFFKELFQVKNKAFAITFIIIALVFIVCVKITWDTLESNQIVEITEKALLDNKWKIIEEYIDKHLKENSEIADNIANRVKLRVINEYDYYTIDNALYNIGKVENNVIQRVIGEEIKDKYYMDIRNDANDPFAMLIGINNEEDSYIISDYSENCAVDEFSQNLYTNYELQSNKELAKNAFLKVLRLDNGKDILDPIFFQFEDTVLGGEKPKISDYSEIKSLFFENKGDFYKTFEGIEFLTPSYIHRDRDILDRFRVVNTVKEDVKLIAIISVFSIFDVVNKDTEFSYKLKVLDETMNNIFNMHNSRKINIYLINSAIMLVDVIAIIIFYLLFCNHYLDDNNEITDNNLIKTKSKKEEKNKNR